MHQPQVCRMWLLTGVLLLSGLALVTGTLEAQSTPEKNLDEQPWHGVCVDSGWDLQNGLGHRRSG